MADSVKFQFLGGADEVGRLALMLETEDSLKLLIEYGMAPRAPPEYPLPAPPVDNILLTHAHLDHSGMIPSLYKTWEQRILTTALTAEISNLLHMDTIKIAKQEGYYIPYDKEDVKRMEQNIVPVQPGETKTLSEDYEVKFHDAGHIPGSLMFEFIGYRKILFTGDFNIRDTRLLRGTKPVPCDLLFLEGTYAGRDHPKKRSEIEKDLIDKIDEVISRGGVAVLPAFAVSRSQEIALILKNEGFNVWFDGMGKKVARMFLNHPEFLKNPEQLRKAMNKVNFVHSRHGRKLALKSEVIVTTSGMMDGGPVLDYMNKLKNDKKSAVLLTGYQVEDTNSRLLVEKGQLDFYGVKEKIECEVEYFDLSAHSGHSELIEFASKCGPEKIILMHSDNREAIAEPLQDIAEVYTPKTGELMSL